MIQEYIIVRDCCADGLSHKVNDKIKEGWKPQGGVCYVESLCFQDRDCDLLTYTQAMVKESNN